MISRWIVVLAVVVCVVDLAYAEKVKRVIDGDTIELDSGKKVHLIGIDAPENTDNNRAKSFAKNYGTSIKEIIIVGRRSARFLRKILEGKEVRLEFDQVEVDNQGNFLAYVYDVESFKGRRKGSGDKGLEIVNGHEVFINATMLKSGYASPLAIPPNIKYAQMFKQLSLEAIKNKRGLWE